MTSGSGGEGEQPDSGPVPVRDLMKPGSPEPGAEEGPAVDPPWEGPEFRFETEEGAWIVRTAGAGAYGTGRTGRARLVAIHFFREAEPEAPVREILVPAGRFPHLRPEELRALFDRATPIVVPGEDRS